MWKPKKPLRPEEVIVENNHVDFRDYSTLREGLNGISKRYGVSEKDILDKPITWDYDGPYLIIETRTVNPDYAKLMVKYEEKLARYDQQMKEWRAWLENQLEELR